MHRNKFNMLVQTSAQLVMVVNKNQERPLENVQNVKDQDSKLRNMGIQLFKKHVKDVVVKERQSLLASLAMVKELFINK